MPIQLFFFISEFRFHPDNKVETLNVSIFDFMLIEVEVYGEDHFFVALDA